MNLPCNIDHVHIDVLVIGGGGAPLRAAIAAKERLGPDGRVAIAIKGELGKCGVTALACSDRMAFHVTLPYTEPEGSDNWIYHARDIYELGGRVSDAHLAMILAKRSYEAFSYLIDLGIPFAKREDGRFDQFVTDGSGYPRACYTGPHTANHIEYALVDKVRQLGIETYENCMVWELAIDSNGHAAGAYGIRFDGRWICFHAGAVVLATGGGGGAFAVSVFPPGQTGDGYAMAYRAGARLVNMEFIQIGLSSIKTNLACSGSMMRAIPRFINDDGEEFLIRYFPPGASYSEIYSTVFNKGASWPVSYDKPSRRIDVAVWKEMRAGHRVFLDFSRNPEGFLFDALPDSVRNFYFREAKKEAISGGMTGALDRGHSPFARLSELNPEAIKWLTERGVDLAAGETLEIAPAIQHFQGGVKIGDRAETNIGGLFACGEVAGGQHGANRPGGNSLLDCQVFGRIAGEEAARFAMNAKITGLSIPDRESADRTKERLGVTLRAFRKGQMEHKEARARIQEILYSVAGVVRTEAELERGLEEILRIRSAGINLPEVKSPEELIHALETRNILDVAEMIVRACLLRKESRGPHLFFSDPNDIEPMPPDPSWEKYIIIGHGYFDERRDSEECSTASHAEEAGSSMILRVEEPVSWGKASALYSATDGPFIQR